MSKEIIGVNTENGPVTPYSQLHAGERGTVDDVLALHEQSRQSGIANPVGVIVFASIGEGAMTQFTAYATPDQPNAIKAALEQARNAGTSSKTTLAISVTGSPEDRELSDRHMEAFLEQGGRAVLFIGSDNSVVINSNEPVFEN
jgi:hypothetical protein